MGDKDRIKEQLIEELVEVLPGVIVAKLNGRGDSQSIQKLAMLMKKRMVETNPSVMVIDLTDIITIDSMAAQCLSDGIRAVRQPGIQLILVGKYPTVHQKLTCLGVNLSDITICHSLITGLWMALDIVESRTAIETH